MDQPVAVLVIATSPSWHRNVHCTALDTAVLNAVGYNPPTELRETTVDDANRRPCLICADTEPTEWIVTPDTIGELWELIEPSKLHTGADPDSGKLRVDGLTILAHGGRDRQLARVGDTIRRHNGEYHVTTRTEQES